MQIFAAGESVFIDADTLEVGQTYLLCRVDGEVIHPRTEEVFGRAINLLGRIEVIQVSGERAMGRIGETCGEIEPGDHLHELVEDTVAGDVDFPPIAGDFLLTELEADATVVHGYSESLSQKDGFDREALGNWETYAAGDVVTIDQGIGLGWAADDRVMLYSSVPEVAAPDDRMNNEPVVMGQGLVIFALEHTAVVMITDGGGTVRLGTRASRMNE
jgi:hypothetical protein